MQRCLTLMARRRSGRAPQVLRRAYRGRTRTLEATILSLLLPPPPSPAECRCRGRRCLGCSGSSHLLRRGDPSDYRTLLTHAFCVISCNAPPPPVFYLCNGLTQRRIVRNAMELIMDNSQVPSNVLCNGYDKQRRFNDIGESLCTYAWELLLARIGDPLMVFLLRFSSIFIPLTNKNHHQVTGPPLDTLLLNLKVSCTTSTPTHQQTSCLGDQIHCGIGRKMKRKRDESEGRPKMDATFSILQPSMLEDVEAINNRTFTSVQNKSPPNELPFQDFDSSSKQNELRIHSKMASRCFNCLMMQASEKITTGNQIKRQYIFYTRFSSSTVFPRNHILNRLKPNESGAVSLMKHIFGFPDEHTDTYSPSCTVCNGYPANKSQCLYHSLLGLLKSLIRNVKRCQNRKLLRRHCLVSLPKQFSKDCNDIASKVVKRGTSLLTPQFDTIESYSRHPQVVSFIWAITRSIVPLELLGDPSTWRTLRKNISKFVRLRRFENFSLKQCIHGLKTSCYPFVLKISLSGCYCNNKELKKSSMVKMSSHNKFFQCWIYWFFSNMVIPMIGANFYVTERESGRQDVFYYPKSVWKKLVGRAVTCLTRQNYSLIDNSSFRNILSKRSFGFSKVRFLPKEKSLRPLANLKAPSKVRFPYHQFTSRYQKPMNTIRKGRLVCYKSVNSSLRELYAILRRTKVEHSQKLGSSVFDYNEIYQKLLRFLEEATNGSRPRVFIVVADVSKAFDSIDQDMLLDIMKDVIQKDEYLVRRYAQIVCTKKCMKALYDLVPYDHSSNQNDITKFGAAIQLCSTNRIFIDQGINRRLKQEKLRYLLCEHLKQNVLQLGRNFYLQKVGIPQGSLLSSLLCSFYYGHLERSIILPYLEKPHEKPNAGFNDDVSYLGEPRATNTTEGKLILSNTRHRCESDYAAMGCTDKINSRCPSLPSNLLLRLIDDFLFISTSKGQAISFFNRMRRGFRDYNCFMNNDKFGLNFDVEQNSNSVNRIYTGADGVSFLPWSGLLLNCHTMEIQADYTRYLGVHIGSTITVKSHAKPGCHLKEKLCDYMRPKCHPIFYDSNINSPGIVKLNAYQAFLLCAMKFHCYTCSMPGINKPSSSYLLGIIERSFSYMYKLIRKRMHDMELDFNVHPVLHLNKVEIVWLGLSAYIRVLKRKHARHKELLSLLRCKFERHWRTDNVSSHLKYAVDDSHSSIFWKVRF